MGHATQHRVMFSTAVLHKLDADRLETCAVRALHERSRRLQGIPTYESSFLYSAKRFNIRIVYHVSCFKQSRKEETILIHVKFMQDKKSFPQPTQFIPLHATLSPTRSLMTSDHSRLRCAPASCNILWFDMKMYTCF